jgi:transcriptional regulator with XRE-family HTH domain
MRRQFVNLITCLEDELNRRRGRNPRYSVRAFAKSLGIHSSTLTRLMSGKRKPTSRLADRILSRLKLDPTVKSSILLSFYDSPRELSLLESRYGRIPEAVATLLDGWEHYAILALLESQEGFRSSARMSRYLKIPKCRVEAIIRLCAERGLVQNVRGRWMLRQRELTTEGTPKRALEKPHREYIEKALRALRRLSPEDHFSGFTLLASKERIPEAVRRIHDFRRSLAQFLATDSGSARPARSRSEELIRLNVQLFSLREA